MRRAAGYVSKEFADTPPGQHRYRAAKGFTPEVERLSVPDEASAWRHADRTFGGPPTRVFGKTVAVGEWD
jgi:hypothetical protein